MYFVVNQLSLVIAIAYIVYSGLFAPATSTVIVFVVARLNIGEPGTALNVHVEYGPAASFESPSLFRVFTVKLYVVLGVNPSLVHNSAGTHVELLPVRVSSYKIPDNPSLMFEMLPCVFTVTDVLRTVNVTPVGFSIFVYRSPKFTHADVLTPALSFACTRDTYFRFGNSGLIIYVTRSAVQSLDVIITA
jgi:hypothetical protein